MQKAFTLIELLVVVLIIGILAAIAVPQYRLAVQKTKVTQDIVSAGSMITAAQEYYLSNNTWPQTWEGLTMDKPTRCSAWSEHTEYYIACGEAYRVRMEKGVVKVRYCYADANSTFQNKLCKSLTGLSAPPVPKYSGNYNRYDYP